MQATGPIVFIDDDEDDQMMFKPVLEKLAPGHQVLLFDNGQEAIDYLRTSAQPPFLIISEVSMQTMGGLELHRQIEADPALRKRAIPFIFFTHPVYKHLVEEAYDLTIQGFFEKKNSMQELEEQLRSIIAYWTNCLHPNILVD